MPWEALASNCVRLLKDSRDLFKLVISSDSMIAVDQRQERADNSDLLQSTGAFFSQMKDMITEYPPMAKFAIKMQERVSRNYKGGKEVEAMYTDMLNEVATIAQQRMAAAAQQPPDPAMMKAQTDMQIAQMTAQGKQAEIQATVANKQTELQIEQVKAQMDIQERQIKSSLEQAKQELEAWKAQQQVLIDNKKIEVEILKVQSNTAVEQANQQIAVMQTNIAATIDALRLDMDRKDNEFQKLAQTVEAKNRQREHMDNQLLEIASLVKSDAPDKKEKVKSGIKRYMFLNDASGNPIGVQGGDIEEASDKPKKPGSLEG